MSKFFYLQYLKLYTISAFMLLFGSACYGQISGSIIDSTSQKPIELATVILLDKDGKISAGATCDLEGNFRVQQVNAGEYNLAVSFLGYQTKSQPVVIPSETSSLDLGKIELSPDNKTLDEVVIRAAKPMVEETEDGYVYNAENDLNAAGGTAADLMKNVPGLSVDMDGNLEMQGTSKIKILIDGKPSAIMAGNIAEALQQIPANMIEKVEVITTPSAKYSAEGAGGVINIITKKNTNLEGYRGGVSATGGNRTTNLNANFTSRVGKLGLRGSAGGNTYRNFGNGENEQIYYTQREASQTNNYRSNGSGFNGTLGGDLDFNDHDNLSATIRISRYGGRGDRSNKTRVTSTLPENFGSILSNDRNTTDNKNNSDNLDLNLDYTRKFKTKGQELNLLMLHSRNDKAGENYTIRQNMEEIVNQRLQNNNNASIKETTFQGDYTQPLKKWGKLEVGTKAILRTNLSSYKLTTAPTALDPLVIDTRRTNIFTYHQDVYATYLSYSFQLKKKLNLRLGGRYEFTNIFADFVTSDTTLRKPYRTLMPNFTTSLRLKKDQRISLNYSTQIFRAQIEYLNPYLDDSNERSIKVGNPNLRPELTHNIQMSYSKYLKNNSLVGSLYWRQTNDDIGQYRTSNRVRSRTADDDNIIENDSIDAITTTYLNLGKNITYGTNLSVSGRIQKVAQIGANFSFYYNEINGYTYSSKLKQTVPVSKGGWMYSIKFNAGFQTPKTYKGLFRNMSTQLTTSLTSPRINFQGKSSSFQQYNISFRKDFVVRQASKDKVSLNFSMENFFNKGNRIRSTTVTDQFSSLSIQNHYNRIFRVGLTYNFSRMEYRIKAEKEKKSIVNEDRQKADIGDVKDIKVEAGENGKAVPAKKGVPKVKRRQR
jgi:outer membrane receptor protein involved in Fe transport